MRDRAISGAKTTVAAGWGRGGHRGGEARGGGFAADGFGAFEERGVRAEEYQ